MLEQSCAIFATKGHVLCMALKIIKTKYRGQTLTEVKKRLHTFEFIFYFNFLKQKKTSSEMCDKPTKRIIINKEKYKEKASAKQWQFSEWHTKKSRTTTTQLISILKFTVCLSFLFYFTVFNYSTLVFLHRLHIHIHFFIILFTAFYGP